MKITCTLVPMAESISCIACSKSKNHVKVIHTFRVLVLEFITKEKLRVIEKFEFQNTCKRIIILTIERMTYVCQD